MCFVSDTCGLFASNAVYTEYRYNELSSAILVFYTNTACEIKILIFTGTQAYLKIFFQMLIKF